MTTEGRPSLIPALRWLYTVRPLGAPIIFWLICAGVLSNLVLAGLGVAP